MPEISWLGAMLSTADLRVYLWVPLGLRSKIAALTLFLSIRMSPALVVSSSGSSSPGRTPCLSPGRDTIVSEGGVIFASNSGSTLMVTGELKKLVKLGGALRVMIFSNVTGSSKTVTRLPNSPSSWSSSSRISASRNSSSPVIALILRLPIYNSPLELIPV